MRKPYPSIAESELAKMVEAPGVRSTQTPLGILSGDWPSNPGADRDVQGERLSRGSQGNPGTVNWRQLGRCNSILDAGSSRSTYLREVVAKPPQDRKHGLGAGEIVEFVRVLALVE